jgi:hypothetical protein
MTTSKFLPIVALVMGLTGAGAMIATAQNLAPAAPDAATTEAPVVQAAVRGDHSRHGDRDGRGGGEGHRGDMFRAVMTAADADGNGALTQAEIDAFRAAQIGAADTSGEGALSLEEFETLYTQFVRNQMVDAFQNLDDDGDGAITPAELDTRLNGVVERMDSNGDGAISPADRRGHDD